MHAATVVKLGWRAAMTRDETIDLVLRALWEAADEDSATGGPDVIRGIYPIVATITDQGFQPVEESELVERFASLLERLAGEPG
jgi:proteasome beta subunit